MADSLSILGIGDAKSRDVGRWAQRLDSSPASLLETMASGIPVIAGRGPSMDEWIQSGHGGELVERYDVPAAPEAIFKLARDPELRKTYGERNLAEDHARFGDPTAQLEQVYREVLGR